MNPVADSTKELRIFRQHSGTPETFSITGERNSGTNFCERLVAQNLDLKKKPTIAWKHGFGTSVVGVSNAHVTFVCFRNAFSWVKSMYAKPWHCRKHMYEDGFSSFIRKPWDTSVDLPVHHWGLQPGSQYRGNPLIADRHPLTGEMFENVFRLRTAKARSYLALKRCSINVVFCHLELLQKEPIRFLDHVAEAFEVRRAESVRIPDEKLGGRGPDPSGVARRLEEIKNIASDDRDFIMLQLDHWLEAELGFSYSHSARASMTK